MKLYKILYTIEIILTTLFSLAMFKVISIEDLTICFNIILISVIIIIVFAIIIEAIKENLLLRSIEKENELLEIIENIVDKKLKELNQK